MCLSCSGEPTPAMGPDPLVGGGSGSGSAGNLGGAVAVGGASGGAGTTGGAAGASGNAGLASTSAGATSGGAGGGGAGAIDADASKTALEQLEAWLAIPAASRAKLTEQAFAKAALTEADANVAQQLLVADHMTQLKATRASEMGASESQAKTITAGGVSMKYYRAERGKKPASGWNLFISMHGGGDADKATNDSQWQNQLALVDGYNPKDAIWIAPRAPTDEWNMWFREHMDALFERLIANFVAFEGVDPNHVYLNGYSAGGDGAYQMGPRMADAWAGVGMSAGHPNDASPLSLRNTAFAIHVGGDDTSFDRNEKAAEWGMKLDELASADAGGYIHQWQVHAGLPHWMDMEDAVSIPFLQQHARDPLSPKVVWRQQKALRSAFYWLAVDLADAKADSEITASYAGQTLSIDSARGVTRIRLRVRDGMLDQDQPVIVKYGGKELFRGAIPRTIGVLYGTLEARGDPSLMFAGELPVTLE